MPRYRRYRKYTHEVKSAIQSADMILSDSGRTEDMLERLSEQRDPAIKLLTAPLLKSRMAGGLCLRTRSSGLPLSQHLRTLPQLPCRAVLGRPRPLSSHRRAHNLGLHPQA